MTIVEIKGLEYKIKVTRGMLGLIGILETIIASLAFALGLYLFSTYPPQAGLLLGMGIFGFLIVRRNARNTAMFTAYTNDLINIMHDNPNDTVEQVVAKCNAMAQARGLGASATTRQL